MNIHYFRFFRILIAGFCKTRKTQINKIDVVIRHTIIIYYLWRRSDTESWLARRKLRIPHQFVATHPPIMARRFQVTFMALICDPNSQDDCDSGAVLLMSSGPEAMSSAGRRARKGGGVGWCCYGPTGFPQSWKSMGKIMSWKSHGKYRLFKVL